MATPADRLAALGLDPDRARSLTFGLDTAATDAELRAVVTVAAAACWELAEILLGRDDEDEAEVFLDRAAAFESVAAAMPSR